MTVTRKKLIEVALPLDAINAACKPESENPFLRGHPRSLHNWWARLPLVVSRAIVFASLVDDPAQKLAPAPYLAALDELPKPEPPTAGWDEMSLPEQRRERLFSFVARVVRWESTNDAQVIATARNLIELSCEGDPPAVLDPFCGRGSIPLEAQRLGLEAHAADLNPVAVLITKGLIEIPPRFASQPPVNRKDRAKLGGSGRWKGTAGLAADVNHYGSWMRDEAEKRVGHLYPQVEVTAEMAAGRPDLKPYVGRALTVVGWLWARTVKSPNPAFADVAVPLASTFMLSSKAGKEAHIEPVVEAGGYRFTVRAGAPGDGAEAKRGTKLARGANFRCLMSGVPIEGDYIKSEGRAGRMGARLMAIVAEGNRGRVYLEPQPEHEAVAALASPGWRPDAPLGHDPRALWTPPYGLTTFGDLFTDRQLAILTTLSDLVAEAT